MPRNNPLRRLNSKEAFWRHHIDCWLQTTWTQISYCKWHDLAPSDFSKWKKKLRPDAKQRKKSKNKTQLKKENKQAFEQSSYSLIRRKCSFCGTSANKARKLFYGKDESVAICDDCLWWKSNKLQVDDKMYRNYGRKECLLCFQDKGGETLVGGRYRICDDCLNREIESFLLFHPSRMPCKHYCINCGTWRKNLEPSQYLTLGDNHIVCMDCTVKIFRTLMGEGENPPFEICYFCREAIDEEKARRVGKLPICNKCCNEMTGNIVEPVLVRKDKEDSEADNNESTS